jgi:tyrosine-protein phosphatase SIW14
VKIWSAIFAMLLGATVVGVPFAYRAYINVKFRNLRVVEPGKLYRSGQMALDGLAATVHDKQIKTVIALREARDENKNPIENLEAEWCRANGVNHITLTPAHWHELGGQPAAVEPNLREFLRVLNDPKAQPVLVHCFAGIHRTGGYVSIYRMHYQGWTAEEAIEEMERMGTRRTGETHSTSTKRERVT